MFTTAYTEFEISGHFLREKGKLYHLYLIVVESDVWILCLTWCFVQIACMSIVTKG
jgi:hypothetical protein